MLSRYISSGPQATDFILGYLADFASPFVEDPFVKQRFDLITTVMSQCYGFTIQHPSNKNVLRGPAIVRRPAE